MKKESILTIVVCVLVVVSGLGGYGFAVLTLSESGDDCVNDCPDYPSEPFPEVDYDCYTTGTRPEGPIMMFVWGFDESQNVWFHTSTMYFNLTGENRVYTCFESGTGELQHAKMP